MRKLLLILNSMVKNEEKWNASNTRGRGVLISA